MSYLGEITIDLASCVAKYEIANFQPLPLHRCINPTAPGVAIPHSLLISVINLFAAVIIKFNILWSSDVPVLWLYRFRSMPAMGNTTTFALLIFEISASPPCIRFCSLLIVSSWLVVRRTVIFVCMSLRVISKIPPAIYTSSYDYDRISVTVWLKIRLKPAPGRQTTFTWWSVIFEISSSKCLSRESDTMRMVIIVYYTRSSLGLLNYSFLAPNLNSVSEAS